MNEHKDGTTWFVTLECLLRQPLLADSSLKKLLLNAIHDTKKQFALHLGGFVIFDDHAHLLFMTTVGDEYLGPINFLRARFLRTARSELKDNAAAFWEHTVKARQLMDVADLRAHIDYIHYDPVHHGICERACDYPWSSLPIRIEQGFYPEEWAVLGPPATLGRFAPHTR
jgi:putative transposase